MSVQERYLSNLEAGLKAIPEGERRDIVEEIRNHIAEAVAAGRPVAEVLQRLGPSDKLARAYAAEVILSGGGRPLRRLLRAAGILMGTGAASLVIVPTLVVLGVTFPIAGTLGFFGNIIRLFFNPDAHVYHTVFGRLMSPAAAEAIGIFLSAAVVALGLLLLVLLKKYIRFMIGVVRTSLNH